MGQVDRLIPILECFVPYTRKYAVSECFCVVRPTKKGRGEVEGEEGQVVGFAQNGWERGHGGGRKNIPSSCCAVTRFNLFLCTLVLEPKINLNKAFYMFFGFGLYFNKS